MFQVTLTYLPETLLNWSCHRLRHDAWHHISGSLRRAFTSLMFKLTAVVAQLLFLYNLFTVSDCYDFHAFRASMIVQIVAHTFCFEAVVLVMSYCQQRRVTFFHVSVASFKLPKVVGTSIIQVIIRCQRISLNKYFRLSIISSSPHCFYSSSFCVMSV